MSTSSSSSKPPRVETVLQEEDLESGGGGGGTTRFQTSNKNEGEQVVDRHHDDEFYSAYSSVMGNGNNNHQQQQQDEEVTMEDVPTLDIPQATTSSSSSPSLSPNLQIPTGTSGSSSTPSSSVASSPGRGERGGTTTLSPSSSSSNNNTSTMNTMVQYFWRTQVRPSAANNPMMLAMLDKLLLVLLFLMTMLETPINYLIEQYNGSTSSSSGTGTPGTKSRDGGANNMSGRDKQHQQPQLPPILKGIYQTKYGAISYITSQGDGSKNNTTTSISHRTNSSKNNNNIQQRSGTSSTSSSRPPYQTPIVCLHQQYRSSDEYYEVVPILASSGRRVVAVDIFGHGNSDSFGTSSSYSNKSRLDDMTSAILQLTDSLLISQMIVIGSGKLGNSIAMTLGAKYPARIQKLILTNLMLDPTNTVSSKNIDKSGSGNNTESVLSELYTKYESIQEEELKLRLIQNELTYIIKLKQQTGSRSNNRLDVDWKSLASKVTCPTLCIRGEAVTSSSSSIGSGAEEEVGAERIQTLEALCKFIGRECQMKVLQGPNSTMYLINQMSTVFAETCLSFLDTTSNSQQHTGGPSIV